MSHARRSDPLTSHLAAMGVDLNARCAEVLFVIWDRLSSPFSDGDIAAAMSEDRNIAARRRGDLTALGYIKPYMKDGEQQMKAGRRGRPEMLWLLTAKGMDEASRLDPAIVGG